MNRLSDDVKNASNRQDKIEPRPVSNENSSFQSESVIKMASTRELVFISRYVCILPQAGIRKLTAQQNLLG